MKSTFIILGIIFFKVSLINAQNLNCDLDNGKEICGLANWMTRTSGEIFLNDRPPCYEVNGGNSEWCNYDEIGVAYLSGKAYYYMNHLHQKISFLSNDTINLEFLDLYTCGIDNPVIECFQQNCTDINGQTIDHNSIELQKIYSNDEGLHPYDCSDIDYWGEELSNYAVCDSCLNCANDIELEFSALQDGLSNTGEVLAIGQAKDVILIGGYLMYVNNENDRDNVLTGFESEKYVDITNYEIKNREINCFAQKGDTTYLGGTFNVVENQNILNIAMIVNGNLLPLKNGIPGNTTIYDIEVVGDDLYVAGFFRNHEGDPNMSYIMKWDGQDWTSLGGGVNGTVFTLEMSPAGLYVGGTFSKLNDNISPIDQKAVGLWNGTSWEALPDLNNSGPNSFQAQDLEYRDDMLYIAGGKTWLPGNPFTRHGLVTYKDGIYTPVGTQIGNTNDLIHDIEWHNGELYIGGNFEDAGGNEDADYFAKLVNGNWEGTGLFSEDVSALHSAGVNLYIGGAFSNLDGVEEIDGIARLGCEVDVNTGIEKSSEQKLISLYPNPVRDMVQFNMEVDEISIYNSIGRKVLYSHNSDHINIEWLLAGIYFVKTNKGNSKQIQKIVKL